MNMRKVLAIGAALVSAAAGLGLAASPASAAPGQLQVTTVWGVAVVTDVANTNNKVNVDLEGTTAYIKSDVALALSGGCVAAGSSPGFAFGATCPSVARAAIVDLKGGDDVFTNFYFPGTLKVYGGAGKDTLSSGPGATDPYLYGGDNADTLSSRGHSTLDGGEGDDKINAAVASHLGISGRNTIFGGGGADVIQGGGSPDVIDGGAGNDTIKGGAGDDKIVGGTGTDTIKGAEGLDTIYAASETSTVDTEYDNVDCGGGARDKARTGTAPKDKRVSCELSL
jgi:Ca2+-binding RTX toxin-like protein